MSEDSPQPRSPLGGRRVRPRSTRSSVVLAEVLSRLLITVGGIGTILAVSLIFFFLLWVVVPLFEQPRFGERMVIDGEPTGRIEVLGSNSHGNLVWTVDPEGELRMRATHNGELLRHGPLVDRPRSPSAQSYSPDLREFALGYPDGQLILGEIVESETFLEADEGRALSALDPGEVLIADGRLVARTPTGQLRTQDLDVRVEPAIETGRRSIACLDTASPPSGRVYAFYEESGRLVVGRFRERYLMLEDRTVREPIFVEARVPAQEGRGAPDHLFLFHLGRDVALVWKDGHTLHYSIDPARGEARLVDTFDLFEGRQVEIAELSAVFGKGSFVVADSNGVVQPWFLARSSEVGSLRLTGGDSLDLGIEGRVTSLEPSQRSRSMAVGTDAAELLVYHVTTGEVLARTQSDSPGEVAGVRLTVKEDGFLVASEDGLGLVEYSPGHPEATLTSLFSPMQYEGYDSAIHKWESTGGDEGFEPKFGMITLIFGTLKATFYSMLFGAPMALLAAIYTSEFLTPRLKPVIKSMVELMASLPSVVLGFLAGLVIAPLVEGSLAQIMAVALALPAVLVASSYLWQLLPQRFFLLWSGWQRITCIALALMLVVPLAWVIGPLLEQLFFGNDLRAWLAGGPGGTFGSLFLLLLPVCVLTVVVLRERGSLGFVDRRRSRDAQARTEFGALLLIVLVSTGLAALIAFGVSLTGWDPRGDLIGNYVQRNALVVGFVMGFAIIPIIYTLADDALASVPDQLRLASLGAGATPWQTTVRIVVPTAMSGLFSAVMIGLGRAVGETMIVLMAAGNTPILDFSAFNGFRTLSANIAVELPEAVPDSTHYRVLFLAGLLLFLMTFALNTLAEIVRQRFRKRAIQL